MGIRFTVVGVVLAVALFAFALAEQTLDDLINRAQTARAEEQPSLYVQIAERKLAMADEHYTAGKVEEARAAVSEVVAYSDKATQAATKTGKKLKPTEIAVRKMAARLRDIKRSLNFEDQAPVEAAAESLEKMRTQLLSRMFGSKEH